MLADPNSDDNKEPSAAAPVGGPAAHEDLTIAEHIRTMLVTKEQRPDETCFLTEDGKHVWLPESAVKQFIEEFGAMHPSDYQSIHGADWQDAFFRSAHA